jgi:hypothetical protein
VFDPHAVPLSSTIVTSEPTRFIRAGDRRNTTTADRTGAPGSFARGPRILVSR